MKQCIGLCAAVVLTLSVLCVPQVWAAGWELQNSPTTLALYGVTFSDPNTWVAVGDLGTILRSTDGGVGWASISSPVGDPLRSVSFRGSLGLAVGIAGRVIRTTDGGVSWTQEPRPTHKNLYSVSIGGTWSLITGEEGGIFVSSDDGVTWTQHTAGTASILFGCSVFGPTGVGVGGQGAVVMSDNSGAGWGLTVLGPQDLVFYSTSFASAATGWAVGTSIATGSIIARTDLSGFVWTAQTAPTTDILFGVSFPTLDAGTAVGGNGAIIHTANGGQLWSVEISPTTQILNAVSLADPEFGLAVGNGGTILRRTPVDGVEPSVRSDSQRQDEAALMQNYPDPFETSTTIRYRLAGPESAVLKVFNTSGREVATLVHGEQSPGTHSISWNASGIPAGVYFCQLRAGARVRNQRMTVVR
jgi:photosystem II stability/assembly factor-like uncharacterized protein